MISQAIFNYLLNYYLASKPLFKTETIYKLPYALNKGDDPNSQKCPAGTLRRLDSDNIHRIKQTDLSLSSTDE